MEFQQYWLSFKSEWRLGKIVLEPSSRSLELKSAGVQQSNDISDQFKYQPVCRCQCLHSLPYNNIPCWTVAADVSLYPVFITWTQVGWKCGNLMFPDKSNQVMLYFMCNIFMSRFVECRGQWWWPSINKIKSSNNDEIKLRFNDFIHHSWFNYLTQFVFKCIEFGVLDFS